MPRFLTRNFLAVSVCVCLAVAFSAAQTQVASLHPTEELVWQRTSPTAQKPDGPVLYQIIFRSSAKPGDIPMISPQFTLTDSLISQDTAGIHIGGLAISSTGAITLCCGQSFGSGGAGGTVTTLTSGPGIALSPSTISTAGSIAIANGGVTFPMLAFGAASAGQVLAANGSGGASWMTLAPPLTNAWGLTGNAGTVDGTDFLGTTDNVPLNFYVNGQRAFRIEPQVDGNSPAPNMIGGFSGNSVTGNAVGATIAGGGETTNLNTVSGRFGTVGGGSANTASGQATVGGGVNNTASGQASTVAGGRINTASGGESTVAGGNTNIASGLEATVGGGINNTASGGGSTVAGGSDNTASGGFSFAAGFHANTNGELGAFVWSDSTATVDVKATAPNQFIIIANGGVGIGTTTPAAGAQGIDVAGMARMAAFQLPTGAAAGKVLTSDASGNGTWQLPAGGGGGWSLTGNTVGCSTSPCAEFLGSTDPSPFEIDVDGKRGLRIEPATDTQDGLGFAPNVIGGFSGNAVTGTGTAGATIAGGGSAANVNTVSASFGAIGGGFSNNALGFDSTVAGGNGNTASGFKATVAGGLNNTASGIGSFAAGQATTDFDGTTSHRGVFLWGDNSNSANLVATADNQFLARAIGGVTFFTSSNYSTGVVVAAGGGSWSSVSDRNVKANFAAIDPRRILARLAAMPISTWNYRSQDAGIRHIGPMAQDFYAAFNVGEDDKHITEIDEGGVAFAAIQGLDQKLEQEIRQKDAQIAAQQKQLESQQSQMVAMQQQMAAVMLRLASVEKTVRPANQQVAGLAAR